MINATFSSLAMVFMPSFSALFAPTRFSTRLTLDNSWFSYQYSSIYKSFVSSSLICRNTRFTNFLATAISTTTIAEAHKKLYAWKNVEDEDMIISKCLFKNMLDNSIASAISFSTNEFNYTVKVLDTLFFNCHNEETSCNYPNYKSGGAVFIRAPNLVNVSFVSCCFNNCSAKSLGHALYVISDIHNISNTGFIYCAEKNGLNLNVGVCYSSTVTCQWNRYVDFYANNLTYNDAGYLFNPHVDNPTDGHHYYQARYCNFDHGSSEVLVAFTHVPVTYTEFLIDSCNFIHDIIKATKRGLIYTQKHKEFNLTINHCALYNNTAQTNSYGQVNLCSTNGVTKDKYKFWLVDNYFDIGYYLENGILIMVDTNITEPYYNGIKNYQTCAPVGFNSHKVVFDSNIEFAPSSTPGQNVGTYAKTEKPPIVILTPEPDNDEKNNNNQVINPKKTTENLNAIIGGAIGGFIFLILLILIILFIIYKTSRHAIQSGEEEDRLDETNDDGVFFDRDMSDLMIEPLNIEDDNETPKDNEIVQVTEEEENKLIKEEDSVLLVPVLHTNKESNPNEEEEDHSVEETMPDDFKQQIDQSSDVNNLQEESDIIISFEDKSGMSGIEEPTCIPIIVSDNIAEKVENKANEEKMEIISDQKANEENIVAPPPRKRKRKVRTPQQAIEQPLVDESNNENPTEEKDETVPVLTKRWRKKKPFNNEIAIENELSPRKQKNVNNDQRNEENINSVDNTEIEVDINQGEDFLLTQTVRKIRKRRRPIPKPEASIE